MSSLKYLALGCQLFFYPLNNEETRNKRVEIDRHRIKQIKRIKTLKH
jgi:hypothetical protein